MAGALATGFVTLIVERQRQKKQGRAAWQLLRNELGSARDTVYEVRKGGDWPIGSSKTWTKSWEEAQQGLLLSPPKDATDEAVSKVWRAGTELDRLENAINAGRPEDERPLLGRDQIFLWELQDKVLDPACDVLGAKSNVQEPPRPPTEEELACWNKCPDRRRGDSKLQRDDKAASTSQAPQESRETPADG